MNFSECVRALMPASTRNRAGEFLADMEYGAELELKDRALATFWREHRLPGKPELVQGSPMPRAYRTTTKRRVFWDAGQVTLDFSDLAVSGACADSVLEPAEHNAIYQLLHEKLSSTAFVALAKALNWIIIRGTYQFRVVVFNVCKMDASVVRKLKQISAYLQASPLKVTAAHVYFDPTRSDYYLEALRPAEGLQFKQLYGPAQLVLDCKDYRLKYPVTGFSQINESMVPLMLERARALLRPEPQHRLLDLYCGYGLFSFGLGKGLRSTVGVEWEGPSIECARESARFMKRGGMQFIAGRIDATFAATRLPAPDGPEVLLLDPPRKGTDDGVIHALAKRHPERVLHIFCGTDEIPRELALWAAAGYTPVTVEPIDMFPGTPGLETLVLLEPSRTSAKNAASSPWAQSERKMPLPERAGGSARRDESSPVRTTQQDDGRPLRVVSPWEKASVRTAPRKEPLPPRPAPRAPRKDKK